MKRKPKKTHHSASIAIYALSIPILLILLCSCLSFDIGDWPSRFCSPHNSPAHNWCGSIGAFCAYYMLYYLGPGSLLLLSCGIVFSILKMLNKDIGQPIFRIVGLLLTSAVFSATIYCLWPDSPYSFPLIGSGGLVGSASVDFLRSQFALLGTFILLLAVWIVGLMLLADNLLIMSLKGIGHGVMKVIEFMVPAMAAAKEHSTGITKIFKKLSFRQKLQAAAEKLSSLKPQGSQYTFDEVVEQSTEHDGDLEDIVSEQPEEKIKKQKPIRVKAAKLRKRNKEYIQPDYDDYTLPPMDLLEEPEHNFSQLQGKVVKSKAAALERLLMEFNVNASVVAADTGPVITMFELELAAGIKVSQISSLSNDIARALGAGVIRVVAPMPGKHTIGIEVPNSEKEKVRIKDILNISGNKHEKMHLPLFLGKDSSGEALISDLASMPHMLIAGTTGSGKSVCINSIITSILLTKRPDEVKLILIDPKMVEMTAFNTVPHLMCPIVTETNRAVKILEWATVKMDERYAVLAEARVKNIASFNKLSTKEIIERFEPSTPEEEAKIPKKLPYFVIIIDELADLMMTAPKEIEAYIVRLAQKSRAVGIHIVLATQRPQATVVTGLIKSNMPSRIGFRVAARMDSRIILDQNGAECLLGQGDMLFLKPGTSELVRAQGTLIDDMEVRRIVKHLKEIAEPQFHPELTQLNQVDFTDADKDDLFEEAMQVVLETQRGSVSLLQRRLGIGYARASRIIEVMASMGVLGEYKGSQAREVMYSADEWEQIKEQGGDEYEDDDDEEYEYEDEEVEEKEDGEEEDDDEEEEDKPKGPTYVNEGQRAHAALAEEDDDEEDEEED